MPGQLENQIIIVTGGSGLLGRAMIDDARRKGGLVLNADINVATDKANGTIRTDISNDDSIQEVIDTVLKWYGRIDGLVNNAYPRTDDWGEKFENIRAESWRRNIDLQLNSTFILCQKILKIMDAQAGGSIVNIGSIYGVVGNDFTIYEEYNGTSPAAYSAIKGGIINFTRYLASYFGHRGIRINCVSPGGIKDNQHESFIRRYESKVPMRRLGTPADIAPAVSFLLSPESSYITGQNLIVDGGWTCI